MILFQQFCNGLLMASLALILSGVTFIAGSPVGLASPVNISFTEQMPIQIAAISRPESMIDKTKEKIQTAIESLTSTPEEEVASHADQMETKTRAAIDTSIANPDYRPGGKSKQAARENQKAAEEMQTKVGEAYN